jgi:serine/threonine-protein kinase
MGAGGAVYEAVHRDLGKRFAVKVLLPVYAEDRMAFQRLELEARALGHLRSRHIVEVSDFGHTEDGRPFFVMPLLAGRTLAQEIRERGCLPPVEAAALILELLAGLDVAHRAGLVHRDVKPDNLFLCDEEGGGRVLKILDFGVAKVLPGAGGVEPPALRSQEGAICGTPRFIAPEQAMGREVGPATDLYGAGLVLYEMLTGRDPFQHVSGLVQLLEAHVVEEAPPPSAVAHQPIEPALDDVVMRALAKRPQDRYASAAELAAALTQATKLTRRANVEPCSIGRSPIMHAFKPGDAFYYYVVERVIGAGHDGAVYEIRHRETGDTFALKTMHAADCVDPNKTARALAAAKGNYRIDHRNVVKVLDLNCEASGLVWMRTEILRGYTIQELITRQGRLSLPFALAAGIEVAAGLAALHEAGIIHRDVKPSNLFYTEGRSVKVLDLGLSKVFAEGLETTAGRRIGLGTPAFSAPEQLEGHMPPDVRCDVYALGITLWMVLSGTHPYADVLGNMTELVKRQLTVMPPLLSEVVRLPPRVDEVLRRAFVKDPAQRYRSIMEMARALMDLAAWVGVEARARRLRIDMPHGEPPLPGDANTWRDYRPPEPVPVHDAPAPEPEARVIVAAAAPPARPARAPRELAETAPLAPSQGQLSRTLPFTAAPAEPPARETPAPVSHSQPGAARPPRRPSRVGPIAVMSAASVVAAVLGLWLHRRDPQAADPTPAPPRPAAVPAGPTETPVMPLVPEITTASASAAASASTPVTMEGTPKPPAVSTVAPRRSPAPAKASVPPTPLPPPPPPPNPRRPFGLER